MILNKHQEHILSSIYRHDKLYIEYNKPLGISTVLRFHALNSAIGNNQSTVIFSDNVNQSNSCMYELRKCIVTSPLKAETKDRFIFPNSGCIMCKSFNTVLNGLCGYRFDNIIFDNCYQIENILNSIDMANILFYGSIFSMLNTNGKIIIALRRDNPLNFHGFFKYDENENKLLKRKL